HPVRARPRKGLRQVDTPRTVRNSLMRRAALVAGLAAVGTLTMASGAQAAQRYVADEVIVKYKSGITEAQRSGLLQSLDVERTIGAVKGVNARVLRVDGDAAAVAKRLNASSSVLYAEPNYILRTQATPNDARFGELYGLNNTGHTGGTADADIDAPEGWDAAGLGSFPATGGTKIGIVDTGIDKAHEDLSGKVTDCGGVKSFGLAGLIGGDPTIVADKCTDDNDHGTHVAGTIAAKANNGVGVAGVSFNSPLSICKALSSGGSGSLAGVANCITYLNQKGAKVISMSLGGSSGATTLQQAVQNAYKGGGAGGSLIIAAAGNDGNATLNYPAAYAEVVSVAATDNRDARASFSNANSDVEVAAPGVDVLSTKRGGGYVAFSGTSMATPHAAGVAGVIFTKNPGLTPGQVRSRLDAAVDDKGAAGRDSSFGFGRVNLAKAAQ
ncbi:MAG TPA: S8 family serine peptidase, partial [Thermoleophilaceae bacterium]|nr:S8 family serine peptidase [Thermoleophilaceae bacterium]